jgi:hypothetical protein
MGRPVNISSTITVDFEDQFSASACKAFEVVKNCADNALKTLNSFPDSLAPGFQGDVALFSKSVDKFDSSINRVTESLLKGQKKAIQFGDSLVSPRKFIDDLWNSLMQMDTFTATASLIGLVGIIGDMNSELRKIVLGVGIATTVVGVFQHFINDNNDESNLSKTLGEIENKIGAIQELTPLEPKISENSFQQFERFSSVLDPFTNNAGLQLTVDLLDNASGDAQNLREELENTFSSNIEQKITIVKETVNLSSSSRGKRKADIRLEISPDGSNDSGGSDDSGGSFDGSSVNPGGFNDRIPSFSTGIDRVPRDMLAMIHKDETVLTKTEAEERRGGNSGGMAVQNVNLHMNMPDSFNPANMKRQDFRQFAMKMQDELRRLDRRMSR